MADLHQVMKEIARKTFDSIIPCNVCFGEVTSTSPLKIKIDQKLELTSNFLILTNNVKDHTVEMTVNHSTDTTSLSVDVEGRNVNLSHSHSYSGKKSFTIHNGLKLNEKVILIRLQGGQKFVVVDRMVI